MIYDRLGRWYDLLTAFGEDRLRDGGLDLLAVRPGETAVEIGCGTGHGLVRLAREVAEDGRAIGIDLSPAMLDVGRRRLARSRLLDRVVIARADARELPLPASSADLVFAGFTLELFDETALPVVLKECCRVLRPGGRLGAVALDARGKSSALRRLYEAAHRRWPDTIDCRPIRVHNLLESAGFEIIEATTAANWGLPVAIVVARKRALPTSQAD
jgi:demethylmenaquinone methyltransferase/2-methoxy-6-polyprenyl-1,4-benzoquinol methylase